MLIKYFSLLIAVLLAIPALAFSFFNTEVPSPSQSSASVLSASDFQAEIAKRELEKKDSLALQLKNNLATTQAALPPLVSNVPNNAAAKNPDSPNNDSQEASLPSIKNNTPAPPRATPNTPSAANVYTGALNTPSNTNNGNPSNTAGTSSWSIY